MDRQDIHINYEFDINNDVNIPQGNNNTTILKQSKCYLAEPVLKTKFIYAHFFIHPPIHQSIHFLSSVIVHSGSRGNHVDAPSPSYCVYAYDTGQHWQRDPLTLTQLSQGEGGAHPGQVVGSSEGYYMLHVNTAVEFPWCLLILYLFTCAQTNHETGSQHTLVHKSSDRQGITQQLFTEAECKQRCGWKYQDKVLSHVDK